MREAVSSRAFRLERGDYRVSGEPVVEQAVEKDLPGALWLMLAAGVLLVGAVLIAVTRSLAGLRALLPVLVGALLAFAALSLLGGSLTLGAIAALPVMLGVGAAGVTLLAGRNAAAARLPVLRIAAAMVAIGFATLLVSPVPLARSFGVLVAVGALLSVVVAGRLRIGPSPAAADAGAAARGSRLARLSLVQRVTRLMKSAAAKLVGLAVRRPRRVLALALVVAVAGGVLSTRTDVVSGTDRLAAADLPELKDAAAVRRATGSDGQVSVIVRSRQLTSPAVLRWMARYQRRVLAAHGFRSGRVCQAAELCPALSLPNLLGAARSSREVRGELRSLPPYFARALITPDRRTANMSFTVASMSVERQKHLFDDMRAQLDPPPGVSAELAGPLVMVADGGAALETNWIALAAIALTLSLLLLLITYRSNRWALVPLLPVAMATGWSALVLFLLPISLNPLTAGLAALVVGFGAAVAAVLSAGYRERRERAVLHQQIHSRLSPARSQPRRDCFGPGRRSSPPAWWRSSRATRQRCDSSGGWRWWTSGLSVPASRWCCRRHSCGPSSAARCRCACQSRAGVAVLRSGLARARSLPAAARSLPARARSLPAAVRSFGARTRKRWSGRKRPRWRGWRRRSEGQRP